MDIAEVIRQSTKAFRRIPRNSELRKHMLPSFTKISDHGLLQNEFYPLGGTPEITPELIGKGLAKRIEQIIAADLSISFPDDTPVVIGASSKTHLKYCKRVGLVPNQVIPLKEYLAILSKK